MTYLRNFCSYCFTDGLMGHKMWFGFRVFREYCKLGVSRMAAALS